MNGPYSTPGARWNILRDIHRIESYRRLGPSAVDEQRRLNLGNLIRFAQQRSPFWSRRLSGVDPANVDLRAIEPVGKEELMTHFDQTVTDPAVRKDQVGSFVEDPANIGRLYLDRYVAAHTSGSTGKRGYFLSDFRGWEIGQALGMGGVGETPTGLRDVWNVLRIPLKKMDIAIVVPLGGHFTSYLMPLISGPMKDHFVRFHYMDILDPFDKIAKELNAVRPIFLHSYPTMIDSLTYYAQRGDLTIRPRVVTAAAEPFTSDIRRRIQAAWPGCITINVYGATEVPAVAKQCKQGRLHYNSDYVIIENHDREGRPVELGHRGDKIYISNLFNTLQPLLRYELTDAVRFYAEPCPCGYPLPTLEVFGRSNDTLWIPDATENPISLLPVPILVAFMEVPGLRQYQIIQQAPRRLRIRYTVDEPGTHKRVEKSIAAVLEAYLVRHGLGGRAKAAFEVVDRIPRNPRTHKVQQIINNVGPPEKIS